MERIYHCLGDSKSHKVEFGQGRAASETPKDMSLINEVCKSLSAAYTCLFTSIVQTFDSNLKEGDDLDLHSH